MRRIQRWNLLGIPIRPMLESILQRSKKHLLVTVLISITACNNNANQTFEKTLREKIGSEDFFQTKVDQLIGKESLQICLIEPYQQMNQMSLSSKPVPDWVGKEGDFGFFIKGKTTDQYLRITRGVFESGTSYPDVGANRSLKPINAGNCIDVASAKLVSMKFNDRFYIYLLKE